MANKKVDEASLVAVAEAIREKSGTSELLVFPEGFVTAISKIEGTDETQTYLLVDEAGNEVAAVLVSEETVFDATANDIRLGKVAATADGVTTGTKEIPSYNTREGFTLITAGKQLTIPTVDYDYTKMQALVCAFNTSLSNSVSTEKVAINDRVYNVQSVDALSVVTKNDSNQTIDFGVTNDSDKPQIVRYVYYKEVY